MALRPLLAAHAAGMSGIEALNVTLAPHLRSAEATQVWYETAALDIGRRGGGTATAARVQERLKELESIPMVVPGGGAFTCVRVPIDEVPRHAGTSRPDAQALSATRIGIYDLLKEAPGLLRPPLMRYLEAIDSLCQGREGAFKRTIRRARNEFAAAVEKQQALTALLDTFRQENEALEQQLGPYLETSRLARARQRGLDPELHAYLDSLTP
jgi:hypothetical protein